LPGWLYVSVQGDGEVSEVLDGAQMRDTLVRSASTFGDATQGLHGPFSDRGHVDRRRNGTRSHACSITVRGRLDHMNQMQVRAEFRGEADGREQGGAGVRREVVGDDEGLVFAHGSSFTARQFTICADPDGSGRCAFSTDL
jgi:hypothetical protein